MNKGLEESIKDIGHEIMLKGRELRLKKASLNKVMQRKELLESEIMEIQDEINRLQELPVKMRESAEARK
jgi:hypothetical protein